MGQQADAKGGDEAHGAVVTLAIDIGGSGLKAALLDPRGRMLTERLRVDTPQPPLPAAVVDALVALVEPLPAFDRISIGFPGVVREGRVVTAPNLGTDHWHRFRLAETLSDRFGGRPARLLNDADVQGYGVIRGSGLEFVLTLGTGVGSALFRDGQLMPHLELGQFPFRREKTLDAYLGNAARKNVGIDRWNARVEKVIAACRTLLTFDTLYLGGGNARRLTIALPQDVRIVSNDAGLTGGIRLWEGDHGSRFS